MNNTEADGLNHENKISPEIFAQQIQISELYCTRSSILEFLAKKKRIAFIIDSNFTIYLSDTNLHSVIREILGNIDLDQIRQNELGDGVIIPKEQGEEPYIDVTLNQSLNEIDPIFNAPFEYKDIKKIEDIIVNKIRQYLKRQ